MTHASATDSSSGTIGHRIIRAGAAVALAHLIFKVVGYVQLRVVGQCLSSRVVDVVYVTVLDSCVFAMFLLGEEVIGPSFLPVFMKEMDTKDEGSAWRFASLVLSVQFILLLLVSLLAMLFPGHVIRVLTAWDASVSPEKYNLAVDSLVWMAPALICLSLGSTTYMILNGYKRFFLAALGDASWKLTVVVSVLVGIGRFGWDYRALVLGLVLGSVAKLGTHILGMLREVRFLRPSLSLRDPALRAMLLLMLPLICGIVFAKVRDIFNNVWILSRLETDGLLQANLFGRKLFSFIGWLIPYALSIAMFPFLCELVDRDDRKQLGEVMSQSARMLLSVFIPLAIVSVVLARPLTFLAFHGGQFGDQVAEWTSVATACYTLVLPAFALEYLLMQAFFAHRRMVAVTVVGVAFSMLSMGVSYVGVVLLGATGATAVAVIALGFTASRTLKTIALVLVLRKNVHVFPLRETSLFLVKVVVVALASAGLCRLCIDGVDMFGLGSGKMALLVRLIGGGAGAAVAFVAGTAILRVEEPVTMLRWAMEKVRRRGARD